MTEAENQKSIVAFCSAHYVGIDHLPHGLKDIIAWCIGPYYRFVSDLAESNVVQSQDATDGIILKLLQRCSEVMASVLVLLCTRQPQSAEALSRTIMESALTTLYIVSQDSSARVIQYFEAYVRQERQQNKSWKKTIAESRAPWVGEHRRRINDKDKYLDGYERLIESLAAHVNTTYPPKRGWPVLYDICRYLGKAVEYRTVYAAMCSQSHHDAEDILNDLVVGVIRSDTEIQENVRREKNNFSLHLVLLASGYFLEAVQAVASKYGLKSAGGLCERSSEEISRKMAEITAEEFLGHDPDVLLPKSQI